MGKTYHPEHFKCKECRKLLSDYFVYNDEPYCKTCHEEISLDKCEYCQKPITEDKIPALGKFWCVLLARRFINVKSIPSTHSFKY